MGGQERREKAEPVWGWPEAESISGSRLWATVHVSSWRCRHLGDTCPGGCFSPVLDAEVNRPSPTIPFAYKLFQKSKLLKTGKNSSPLTLAVNLKNESQGGSFHPRNVLESHKSGGRGLHMGLELCRFFIPNRLLPWGENGAATDEWAQLSFSAFSIFCHHILSTVVNMMRWIRSRGQVRLVKLLASSNSCHWDGWTLRKRAELDTCHGVVECSPRRNTYQGEKPLQLVRGGAGME